MILHIHIYVCVCVFVYSIYTCFETIEQNNPIAEKSNLSKEITFFWEL